MIRTKIDTSRFTSRLNRIENRLDNLPWNVAARIVRNSVANNFEIGGRYSQPDSPRGGTNKWKPRKDNLTHKILKKSGRLQAANYMEVHKNGFAVGNKLKYQAVHNFGYSNKNIPARPFLVYQDEDMKAIKNSFCKYIVS